MSLDKRIADLERLIGPSEEAGEGRQRRLVSEFLRRALDALAHVRRSSIDPERWRYGVERLEQEDATTVAAYLCVLRDREHEDEARAREILEEKARDENADLDTLEKLMGAFAAFAVRARAERAGSL